MAMDVDDRTLFIGNIDKNVTEEILYELFLQAGPIERVNIPGRNDSTRYGFITYKYECSINYAIELFKGTNLFKKELSIKKRCPKSNSNPDFSKLPLLLEAQRQAPLLDPQSQLHNLKLMAQNLTYSTQPLIPFPSNSHRNNFPSRSRPYDVGMKNHFSRPREIRDRRKNRNYGSKSYHGRTNRHRD